jgi:hypothetical protein
MGTTDDVASQRIMAESETPSVLDYRSPPRRPAPMPWRVILRDVLVLLGGLALLTAMWIVMSV